MHDIYIDDLISLGLDLQDCNNRLRLEAAPLLAIDACSCRIHDNEPIPCHNMATLHKLTKEGHLKKTKMILGWLWDFRLLTISIHIKKVKVWSSKITKKINTATTTLAELESTIRQLTHVSMILPPIHHFLSRLRKLLLRSTRVNWWSVKITPIRMHHLHLMNKCFLVRVRDSINMNQTAYRRPPQVHQSDSCPAGLRGYSREGFAWRFYLDNNIKFRASNNLLKHLAIVISPWIDILAGRLRDGDHWLSMMDSTTLEDWMRKTIFKEDIDKLQATIRFRVAQSHASQFMSANIREYSQWFQGSNNQVANALSCNFDQMDKELTQVLFTHVPAQVPPSFKIVPLSNKISSYVTLLLQRLRMQQRYSKEHRITTMGHGNIGGSTANPLVLAATTSLNKSHKTSNNISSALLSWLCVKGDFCNQLMLPWLLKQSAVPSITWQWPSGIMGTIICHTTNKVPSIGT
jgi:hypothetical protein